MHSISLLLGSFLLLGLAQSLPSSLPGTLASAFGELPGPVPKTKHHCSANQNNSIPTWASDPAWNTAMTSCLQTMNNTGWNGAECKPTDNGVALGPSFGFWKGEDNYSDGGQDCFNQCQQCLSNGIAWNQAVTTTCEYETWPDLESDKKHCDMGFTYDT